MTGDLHPKPEPPPTALEHRLCAMDAVYRRYGREGLRDYPFGDVTLLLASKKLELRDAPQGRDNDEKQRAASRLLELEIRELSGHVDAVLSGAGLSTLQRAESRLRPRTERRGPNAGHRPEKSSRNIDREA